VPDAGTERAPSITGNVSRQRILDVSAQLFFDKGYAATSIRDIADALGLVKSALYNHFESKEDILQHVVAAEYDRFNAQVIDRDDPERPVLQRLQEFFERHLRVLLADTVLARVAALPFSRHDLNALTEEHRRAVHRSASAYQHHLVGLIALGQKSGVLRSDILADAAAKGALGMLNSLMNWYQSDDLRSDAVIRTYVAILMDGLRAS
jgi:AcrR family transcriptional regulator